MASHTPDYLAERLGVPRSWVMRHLHELPHQRPGRHVRFTDQQVDQILAMYERRPINHTADTGLSALSRTHLQRRTSRQGPT